MDSHKKGSKQNLFQRLFSKYKRNDHSEDLEAKTLEDSLGQAKAVSIDDIIGLPDIAQYDKIKILDTNVVGENATKLLDPEFLTKKNSDEKVLLVLPYGVNHELNRAKSRNDDSDFRHNARKFFRLARNASHNKDSPNVLELSDKKHIYIQTEEEFRHSMEYTIDGALSVDDSIRKMAKQIRDSYDPAVSGKSLDLEVLTFDTTILFNSSTLDGIEANPPKDIIMKSMSELYSGWKMITSCLGKDEKKDDVITKNTVKRKNGENEIMNMLQDDHKAPDDLEKILKKSLVENEFVFLRLDDNNYEILRNRKKEGLKVVKRVLGGVNEHESYGNIEERTNAEKIFGRITPLNIFQEAYADLLYDEDVDLVMAYGPAGNGKTLLAMCYGEFALKAKPNQDYKDCYPKNLKDNVLVVRSLSEIQDEGVSSTGYLPGSEQEKMRGPGSSIYDNAKILFGDESKFQQYMESGKWQIKPIGYMRGRSLLDTVLIMDEPQNFTTRSMKTALTRPGQNTKVIMAGDPLQNDIKGSGYFKNGYTDTIRAFTRMVKRDNIDYVGAIYLPATANERSRLSRLSTNVFENGINGY
ncbi:MAG: PhoH family protein [Candidatus Woesearchaeota archaeon]